MGNMEFIRDFNGRIIGKYEFMNNGDIIVRDFNSRILGFYKKASDTTTDFNGRTIARGNAVGLLLNLRK